MFYLVIQGHDENGYEVSETVAEFATFALANAALKQAELTAEDDVSFFIQND